MARIRTVKPELFTNERCAECSVSAVLTFIGLFTQADDHGRHRDNAAIIAGVLWPLRSDHTPVHVEEDLQQLTNAGLICRYTGCDGKRYLHIVGWFEHQKIDKPSQSRYPTCTEHRPADRCGPCKGSCTTIVADPGESPTPAGGVAEDSPNARHHLDQPAQQASTPPDPYGDASTAQRAAPVTPSGARDRTPQTTPVQGPLSEPSTRAPRRFDEGSAPGSRILDQGSPSPTGRAAPAATVTANDLVGEYVAACAERPPADVLGHLGRLIKRLLAEDIAVTHIRAGLKRYTEIQGHPSRLPSLVNDSMNTWPARSPQPNTGPHLPSHRGWTNPTDTAAYAEEL